MECLLHRMLLAHRLAQHIADAHDMVREQVLSLTELLDVRGCRSANSRSRQLGSGRYGGCRILCGSRCGGRFRALPGHLLALAGDLHEQIFAPLHECFMAERPRLGV